MGLTRTVVRITVILLAVAGVTGHVAYLDALWWHSLGLASTMMGDVRGPTILLLSAHAIVSIVCTVLSVILVLDERLRQGAARALGVTFASWGYLMSYSGVTALFRPVAPGIGQEIFEAHFLAVEVLGLAGLLRFTSIFPRPLSDEELAPTDPMPPVLAPIYRVAVKMRSPHAPTVAALTVLAILWGTTQLAGGDVGNAGLGLAMGVVRFVAAGLVVMNLRQAWERATEGDRDGLAWLLTALTILVASLALLMGGRVLIAVAGFPEPVVAWKPILLDLGMIGFFVAVSLSVLDRGRHDPAHLTRRIASTTVVVTAGLFLASGLEALFAGGVLAAFSVRPGVGTAVAFAIGLATFRGFTSRVEKLLPQ